MRTNKALIAAVAVASCTWAGTASADELALYGQSIDFENSSGCLTIGDAISCSAPLLNVLAGLSPTTLTDDGGYVFQTNQGTLRNNYIVLSGGGGAADNSDIDPVGGSGPAVEDGFKSNDVANDQYFATGQTGTTAGNLSDPDNNNLTAAQDSLGTWDVDIGWLIEALTFDEGRHQLLIGFDYNEPQSGSPTTLDYWSLVTLVDSSGLLPPINYEIRSPTGQTYDQFVSNKTFDGETSKPSATDFSTVLGTSCVDTDGSESPPILNIEGGGCPAGYETTINNTLATNLTEIIAWLPELDMGLESFQASGYDTVSARVLLGCFDNNSTAGTIGTGYLSGDGSTTNCGEGGFPDIFLMAGDVIPTENVPVPAPAPLLLLGAGLLGLTTLRWRARRRN
ncbi:hypothetical protein Q6D67_18850 [Haliea sp. E1-2-M8]|uniref:hypothetical protein n=1 Tax=Haliea sp. E1-2-M8 TaxID=3064706 RepID=UPI00271D33E9|nr:hypothetical protein [Haliea sp. E1-2-M8]MDO8863756.1 hypothetical protein [Haliea sp. E1-2-M8]